MEPFCTIYIYIIKCFVQSSSKYIYKVTVFKVLTVVIIKISRFWGVTSCSLVSFSLSFGGTYRLYQNCESMGKARNQQQASFTLKMEVIFYKVKYYTSLLSFTGLHKATSQKIQIIPYKVIHFWITWQKVKNLIMLNGEMGSYFRNREKGLWGGISEIEIL
jgi:hypothetical protein